MLCIKKKKNFHNSFCFVLCSYQFGLQRPFGHCCPFLGPSTPLCISRQEHLQWIQAPQTGSVLWWRRVSPRWRLELMAPLVKGGNAARLQQKSLSLQHANAVRLHCSITLTGGFPAPHRPKMHLKTASALKEIFDLWRECGFSGIECGMVLTSKRKTAQEKHPKAPLL